VKTGRITIEFQYVAPISAPSLFWPMLLPDDVLAWNFHPSATGLSGREAAAWRRSLLVYDQESAYATRFAVCLGDSDRTPLPILPDSACPTDWLARTYITSVQMNPESGAPIQPPLAVEELGQIRLEFMQQLAPLSYRESVNTNETWGFGIYR
jgi:hypothetical protein